MSRSLRFDWLSRRARRNSTPSHLPPHRRSLRFEPLEDRQMLAVFSVTSLNDSGAGSLRAAIDAANLNTTPDTIQFSVTGTINIASQLPTISQPLTIVGPGANLLTINAGGGTNGIIGNGDGWRIFNVDNGFSTIAVAISGLKLTGGDVSVGGAINNAENLTIRDTWIVANSGNFGGGIVNSGTLTVESSTISDNLASSGGGGINSSGTATIRNSTISGNDAGPSNGGGIINYAPPAGTASLIVENSTITNNMANVGSALHSFGAGSPAATINNSVMNGAVAAAGTLTGGDNLFSGANPGISGANNQFNIGILVVNDTGNEDDGLPSSGVTTLREAISIANTAAGPNAIIFSALFNSPQTTPGSPRTISIVGSQLPTISDTLTIFGPGADLLTINAGNGPDGESGTGDGWRIFEIDNGVFNTYFDVKISGLTLTGGDSNEAGGAIRNFENLTVTASAISGNAATGVGGGIANFYGVLTVTATTISGNSSGSDGGGIFSATDLESSQKTIILNSTISGNSAQRGGGVYNSEGLTTIRQSTIVANTAAAEGGGVWSSGNTATRTEVLSSIIAANAAPTTNDVHLTGSINSFLSLGFNLVGVGNAIDAFDQPSDQVGVTNPLVGPLAFNGGPTRTHAVLLGSPAFNAGDPSILFDADEFDQRGRGFSRAVARIEIGAFESSLIVVNHVGNEDDGLSSNGVTTLREAISLANAAAGTNTITFSPLFDSPQTISIASQLPTITDALTITGPGANLLTIDAGNGTDNEFGTGDGWRIFNIDNGNSTRIDVTISGLTLTGGDVASSDGFGWGGAIRNRENLTVNASAIHGNATAVVGGGIAHFNGDLTVTATTISGNRAGVRGGGVYSSTATDISKPTTILNSTISGNSAQRGGGVYNSFGIMAIRQSTITANAAAEGGGVGADQSSSFAFIQVYSSIIAGNTASLESNDVHGTSGGGLFSGGYNLVGSGNRTGQFQATGDQTGVDPLLGPLAFNGGPTRTHALLPDSPAFDAGSPAINGGFDQRGLARVVGSRIDIGAFELQAGDAFPLVVSTVIDERNGDYSFGNLSLREAIELANLLPGTDSITFTPSLTGTIDIASQLPTITDALTIAGPGADLLTINAGNGTDNVFGTGDGYRIFNIDSVDSPPILVTISGLTLTGGDVASSDNSGRGGAIRNREKLTLIASTISGNAATSLGGGIDSDSGSLSVIATTISGNRAGSRGGGIFSNSDLAGNQTTLHHVTISGNSANLGGGVFNTFGLMAIWHSTITANTAAAEGGGVWTFGETVTRIEVSSSIIAGNAAPTNKDAHLSGATSFFQSLGYNLVGNGNAFATFVEPGDQVGVTDPLLGQLAFNGGPTRTHALLPGSPALDAGNPDARAAGLVTPIDVVSSTSPDLYPAERLIDGSGLGALAYDNIAFATHAPASADNAWVTQLGGGNDYFTDGTPPVLTFDLGAHILLTDIVVWGYGLGPGQFNNNEAKTFEVSFSVDGGATYSAPITLQHARTGIDSETLSFGGVYLANKVRVRITDNHFGTAGVNIANGVGLGEVRFLHQHAVFDNDQRGVGFQRVVDGNGVDGARIDIGAYESQGVPTGFPAGDYNHDGIADAADYTVWRNTLNQTGDNLPANGDNSGTSENKVDAADYAFWKANFGNTTVPVTTSGTGASVSFAAASTSPELEQASSTHGSGSGSFALPSADAGTPRSPTVERRYAFIRAPLDASTSIVNQRLLALDLAFEARSGDASSVHLLSDTKVETDDHDVSSPAVEVLVVALCDWF